MWIFIGVISFVIVYSIIEAFHDLNVIKDSTGKKEFISKWHLWGWFQNVLVFTPVVVLLFVLDNSAAWSLTIAIGFLFWQLHDSLIGFMLHRNVFYLSKDKISTWIEQVFQNGKQFMVIRSMFILCGIIEYFRQIN